MPYLHVIYPLSPCLSRFNAKSEKRFVSFFRNIRFVVFTEGSQRNERDVCLYSRDIILKCAIDEPGQTQDPEKRASRWKK